VREGPVLRWVGWGIAAGFRARASLVAENICLRQQLLVLRRQQPRPRIREVDRRFWVLACRWFAGWRSSLLIVRTGHGLEAEPPGLPGLSDGGVGKPTDRRMLRLGSGATTLSHPRS
jgi:hypothetical protein